MCRPDQYGLYYEINPWMDKSKSVDLHLAKEQWKSLEQVILKFCEIEYIDPQKDLPDMVFTANAGLVYKSQIILSKFLHPERQGEESFFDAWFKKLQFDTCYLPEGLNFEGAGDALFCGQYLFGGYGFRSDKRAYHEIANILDLDDIIYCELVDPHFYHLDTCFCPIGNNWAMLYPGAFSKDSLKRIENHLRIFPVEKAEARRFACNAVVIENEIILSSQCPNTEKMLNDVGYRTHSVETSEFIRSGGSAKCLTLCIQ